MKIQSLVKSLHFVGEAAGASVRYEAFESDRAFLLFSPSNRGGFVVNVVDKTAPERIARSFAGQEVTSGTVARTLKRLHLAADFPIAVLYVMVALGVARKLQKRDGRFLVFKIQGSR